ncbi:MAG: TonB-dependent receptor [Steroidobacteraceae bacterium]
MSKILACLSGVAVAMVASTATAQTEGETAVGLELEEIVVTAEKRDTNLQKTAESITVFTGEQLKREGKTRVDEILNGVAGINLQSNQVGSDVFIRGNSQGVAVVVDGSVNMRSEALRGATLDVSQVEVMRGTQAATTLGGNVLAGAVSLVSNTPVFEYQASGSVEVGSYELRNTEGVLNLPIADNQALRVGVSSNKRNGYISANAGNSEQFQGRLKYRWKPTDDLDIVATINNQKIGGNGVSAGTLLYTGHWTPWTTLVGSNNSFNWTNPLTGATSTYAGYGANTNSVFRSPVNNLGVVATTGTTYSLPCYTGGTPSLVSTSSTTAPLIYTIGCPAMFAAVRDGVTYDQRSNPWDDGYPADVWPNNPYRRTDIKSYQLDINWDTAIGKLTAVPSVQKATFVSQETQRGTSYMAENRTQSSEQLDVRLASNNNDSNLIWLGGLNYNHTGASEGLFRTISLPVTAYPTAGGTQLTNCYITNSPFLCYVSSRTLGGGTTDMAAYANGTLSLLADKQLRVSAGARYNHSKVSYNATNELLSDAEGNNTYYLNVVNSGGTYTATSVSVPYTVIKGDAYYNHSVWNAGVEYDLMPEVMAYANYATGFQRGTLGVSGMGVSATSLAAPTPGLTLEQMSLGLKSRWFENKLQVNVEAFDSRYHNRTFNNIGLGSSVGSTAGAGTGATCTVGSANPAAASILAASDAACVAFNTSSYYADMKSAGVDLDVVYLPFANDRIDFSLEYLKSYVTGVKGISGNITSADILSLAGISAPTGPESQLANTLAANINSYLGAITGSTLTNSPRWSGNLSYQHEFAFASGGKLTPRAAVSYKSEYWINPSGGTTVGGAAGTNAITESALAMKTGNYYPLVQRSYALYDFYTTYEASDGKWQLSGYVKNIENKAVMTSASPSAAATSSVALNNVVVTGGYVDLLAPRTIGLILRANF